ncbi:MAG: hypothetical protein JST92_09795 [Deltaproteobacteria bacterium]|nr:hypothetical protein [Deltaproteobacteria bacterium]
MTAPRTQDPVGWFFSPWTKFTFNVGSEASTRVPALGPWMCRVAAERGTPLARFRLMAVYTPPRQSLDEPLPASREVLQFEQTCPRP